LLHNGHRGILVTHLKIALTPEPGGAELIHYSQRFEENANETRPPCARARIGCGLPKDDPAALAAIRQWKNEFR
jgi:hypothetical protein